MMMNDTRTTCTVEIMTDDRETCVEKISMGHDSFVSKNGMDTEGFGEKVTVDERACHGRQSTCFCHRGGASTRSNIEHTISSLSTCLQ